ncbi:hypothetical protein MKW98_008138 [Papaver atlanticum]|uniref:Uncharacterized protein n=1 Tax=Papaver atlanticum TaxID=357466 RepID=A0AAD4S8M9_9MAGN|nr:hypothetical protein MKW98_008138 [Papaver atlanticum]
MWLFGRGSSGFSFSNTAEEVTNGIDATGLTAIITGKTLKCSKWNGCRGCSVLALRGAHVVIADRNVIAGRAVKEDIIKKSHNAKVDVMELDLSSMASVRKFADEFKSSGLSLNILINNAGIATNFKLSQDNIELVFATNHLGHFLLTNLLLDTMKSTARKSNIEGRIINVASGLHWLSSYGEGIRFDNINEQITRRHILWSYAQSKLANILHANELARRLKESEVHVTANSLHPGTIVTPIYQHTPNTGKFLSILGRLFTKNVQQGASTTCYVALHPDVKGISGQYFVDNNISTSHSKARDIVLAKKLWDFSMELTKH